MINRCTRFCRNLTITNPGPGMRRLGAVIRTLTLNQLQVGETELLVSGSQQELEQMSGNIWHDAIQEQGTSSAAGNDEQTGAGHQGEEETEVVDLSDDEDMSIPLITIAD